MLIPLTLLKIYSPIRFRRKYLLILLLFFGVVDVFGYQISGAIQLDDSWEPRIYLSLVPDFESINTASGDFIIGVTDIDEKGYFSFQGINIPEEDRLYRLHVCKKGDPVATIFIGGKEENHTHFIMNNGSALTFSNSNYLFAESRFMGHPANDELAQLELLINRWKQPLVVNSRINQSISQDQLSMELSALAESSTNDLVSMLAFHHLDLIEEFDKVEVLYDRMTNRWKQVSTDTPYLKELNDRIAFQRYQESGQRVNGLYLAIAGLGVGMLLFFIFQRARKPQNQNSKVDHSQLTIQEHKVYKLLSEGRSNKEISSELNISLSTVKSHVHNIYGKLGISSRKEVYGSIK